jgi:hypothetical protein
MSCTDATFVPAVQCKDATTSLGPYTTTELAQIDGDCAGVETSTHAEDASCVVAGKARMCDAFFEDKLTDCYAARGVLNGYNDTDQESSGPPAELSQADQDSVVYCETQVAQPARQACLDGGPTYSPPVAPPQ